jgi:predicted MPP superfamily phosphohydrolase
LSWGYMKKGNTHFYVTSGAGTVGPPLRIGTISEIVDITLKFK